MSDDTFPPSGIRLSWRNRRSPEFRTQIEDADSGRETAWSLWALPRYRWRLTYGVLHENHATLGKELEAVMGFFLKHRGRGDSFRFQDPEDNAMTDEVFGTGDGARRTFQIRRDRGGFKERIDEVDWTTIVVKLDGVPQTKDVDYMRVHSGGGLITFISASPPANNASITTTCSFWFRVRFLEDTAEFENFSYKLHRLKRIDLISVR